VVAAVVPCPFGLVARSTKLHQSHSSVFCFLYFVVVAVTLFVSTLKNTRAAPFFFFFYLSVEFFQTIVYIYKTIHLFLYKECIRVLDGGV
jgi:hypothetical protein